MIDFLRNIKIRTKLISGFTIIFLLLLIIGVKDYNDLRNYEEKKQRVIHNISSAEKIKDAAYYVRTEMFTALKMLHASELREIEQNWDFHLRTAEQFNSTIQELKDYSRMVEDRNLNIHKKQLQSIFTSINEDYENIILKSISRIRNLKQDVIDKPYIPSEEAEDIQEQDIITEYPEFEEIEPTEEPDEEAEEEPEIIFQLEESATQSLFFGDKPEDLRLITLNEINNHVQSTGNRIIKQLENADKASKSIIRKIQQDLEDLTTKTWTESLIFILLGLILSILIGYFISNLILNPISSLSDLIAQLARGELPENIEVNSEDEIGEMTKGLNSLVNGLKKTARFSVEIGKGNFESQFKPMSDKDVLGNSLLDMRTSLQKVKQEEEKRKIEDERRSWATQGLARFGEILRHRTDDIKELSNRIINNLVKYLKANQGGLFIYDDSDKDHPVLELAAAYAFNRKKYLEKKVEIGEGLVGMCALEKYTIHLTEIPDDYINIESGLGTSNPKAILIVPVKIEKEILGVIELASFNDFRQYEIDLVEKIADSVASTFSTLRINARTAELLEQSQKQAVEMQEQEEEMRQNMEELRTTQEEAVKREQELKQKLEQLSNDYDQLKQKSIKQQNVIMKLKGTLEENNIEIATE